MNKEYIAELEKIEAVLTAFFPAAADAAWCGRVFPNLEFNPATAENLLAPGRDLFTRGGKRWRPLLAHLLCRALGGGDAVLPLVPLVEFCHNGSLIHDDLEDNSDERRGKPAIHLLYGSDTAINSGSFLYFLPLAALETWTGGAEDKIRLWRLWAEHMRSLHLGQSMDIAWHRDAAFVPTLDEYMLMCGLKTGGLSRFAALLGVEAARAAALKQSGDPCITAESAAPEKCAAALAEAAQKLGVGFQILDDVKNLSTGIPGKKRGDDVVEGKKSLPVLLFLGADGAETAVSGGMNRKDRAAFAARCFKAAREGGTTVPEVEEFIAALTETGALAQAERQGKVLIAETGKVFASLQAADSAAGSLLAALPELLAHAGS